MCSLERESIPISVSWLHAHDFAVARLQVPGVCVHPKQKQLKISKSMEDTQVS